MKRRVSPATIERVEHDAYDRAADLAKSYAEHYEAEAHTTKHKRRRFKSDDWSAEMKAGHWRIIEKEIRGLARTPGSRRRLIFRLLTFHAIIKTPSSPAPGERRRGP